MEVSNGSSVYNRYSNQNEAYWSAVDPVGVQTMLNLRIIRESNQWIASPESSLNKYPYQYLEEVNGMDDDRARALEIYCKDIASWADDEKDFEEILEEFN